ncbi:MAG: hypothetical protein DCC58_02680 [Chloroflexi bacterium]|nr:MAG: hypothetical protein DCC58_02680 [Chloroflexota bacterium]
MPYRFVLEVPDTVHEEVKVVVDAVHDARVVIERHPRPQSPDSPQSYAELTVACHSLDVVDEIYRWLAESAVGRGVVIDAYNGSRVELADYDPRAVRRMIQGDQYWMEHTVPRIRNVDLPMMEGGARVAEVPYGGRLSSSALAVPAESHVELGAVDAIAVRVRDLARAEAFYRDFFGMGVAYRARREDDRWRFLDADFDWTASIHDGIVPEIVRLENGPVALVLINAGMGAVMHENRVAYVSVTVSSSTLARLRGRALFANYTVLEDSPRAFRFADPFGVTWQLVVND